MLFLERLVGGVEEEGLGCAVDEENDDCGLSRVAMEACENEDGVDDSDGDIGDHSVVVFETMECMGVISVYSSEGEVVGCVSCDCADDDASCMWIEKMHDTNTDGEVGEDDDGCFSECGRGVFAVREVVDDTDYDTHNGCHYENDSF